MFNASHEYTSKNVKDHIAEDRVQVFEFLVADQDAFAAGESLGIDHDCCMNFTHGFAGMNTLCSRMNHCMNKIRKTPKK